MEWSGPKSLKKAEEKVRYITFAASQIVHHGTIVLTRGRRKRLLDECDELIEFYRMVLLYLYHPDTDYLRKTLGALKVAKGLIKKNRYNQNPRRLKGR